MKKTETMKNGTRVKLAHGSRTRNWWTIRASDARFVILNRQAPFAPKGEYEYTIIDWERGVRGPCNLIGQGWDTSTSEQCEKLLRGLNYHLELQAKLADLPVGTSVPCTELDVEVSYRNNVPAEVTEIEN